MLLYKATYHSFYVLFLVRGFFPKGGGEIKVTCSPIDHFQPIQLVTPGNVTSVEVSSHVAGVLPVKVSHSQ